MAIKSSANAIEKERNLAHHQALLTLVQGKLSDPDVGDVLWLDICCGKGQVLKFISQNLSSEIRKKVKYIGFDGNEEYLKSARHNAQGADLRGFDSLLGDVEKLGVTLPTGQKYDIISIVNVFHEVSPSQLAELIFEAMWRLTDNGLLFIFDLEELEKLELGAVPWRQHEIDKIFESLMVSISSTNYKPPSSRWVYTNVPGWSIQINRAFSSLNSGFENNRSVTTKKVSETILNLLKEKQTECDNALESYLATKLSTSTSQEDTHARSKLFDYWALDRAIKEFGE